MSKTENSAADGLARSLDLAVILVCVFTVFFRSFGAGQDVYSIPTAFLELLIFFGALLWLVARLAVPQPVLWLPKAGAVALAVCATTWIAAFSAHGANMTQAFIFARHWTFDILLFFMIFDVCRTRERRALIVSALFSALAVIILYCAYQKLYALDYFRHVVESTPGMIPVEGEKERAMFLSRVASTRISGPYGYSNAVANYLLLFLPLLWLCVWKSAEVKEPEKQKKKKNSTGKFNYALYVFLGMAALGHLSVSYSVSKGGLLAGKVVEILFLCALAYRTAEPQKRFRKIWEAFSVSVILTIVSAALCAAAAKIFSAHAESAAMTVWGLGWFAGIIICFSFAVKRNLQVSLSIPIRAVGTASMVCGIAVLLWLLAGAPGAPEKVAQKLASAKESWDLGKDSASVRKNYWIAAVNMIRERPVLGMGLDQYGSYYTSYKPMEGWAVRRVHNTYLQVLTDGGIVLFVPWLLFWLVTIFSRESKDDLGEEEPEPDGLEAQHDRLLKGALLVIGVVFFLQYVARVLFGGLGIEFFWNEVFRNGKYVRPESLAPALIHLITHIVILPAGAYFAFKFSWKLFLRDGFGRVLHLGLIWGLIASMLHLFVEFTYHMQLISTTMWVLAALALNSGDARNRIALALPFKRRVLDVAILVLVVAFCALGFMGPLRSWKVANLVNGVSNLEKMDPLKAALVAEEWAAVSPEDPGAHRKLASLYQSMAFAQAQEAARQHGAANPAQAQAMLPNFLQSVPAKLRNRALEEAQEAVRLDPATAAGYAFLGRIHFMLFHGDREHIRKALENFEKASRRHPYKPEYISMCGKLHLALGEIEQGKKLINDALKLNANPHLSDERAQLSENEIAELKALLQ